MNNLKTIRSALISVFYKENLTPVIHKLKELNIKIISTGGTKDFIEKSGVRVTPVEDVTGYPSILGGRVKTLHPGVFGGILYRRSVSSDREEVLKYQISDIDLVIVDLYPFEETVSSGVMEEEVIEKIDIGGISLIRAAAKNFDDVLVVSSSSQYGELLNLLEKGNGQSTREERKKWAGKAFTVSSHYDTCISRYFNGEWNDTFQKSIPCSRTLRYGENPHQKGVFYGDIDSLFEIVSGKEISYNNLLDIEAAIHLIRDFKEPCFAIIKHNNPCGVAVRKTLVEAWKDALAGDPVSAFGGIIIANRTIDFQTAKEINSIFFEVIIAPGYEEASLELLKQKKNRIILINKKPTLPPVQFRSLLNGVIVQEKDLRTETAEQMKKITSAIPSTQEYEDLEFANIIVKHSKSNAIVLAKNRQLIGSGVGQTSRVDALKQAIEKAQRFHFDLQGAALASDAFFPFADCVELAYQAGIRSIIQPGGSIRDKESIEFCDKHGISMVFTGIRHFKH